MKKIISVVIFCVILVVSMFGLNRVFVDKSLNRYYILSHEIDKIEDIDVQVYGSCHAYTSFDTAYFTETSGVSSYNMSNPGEIIPTTYLRMLERFKKDKPEVALVEVWGVNAYETYDSTEKILGNYLPSNLELIPFSREKREVIQEFETLDMIEDNFAFIKYRERLLEFSLTEVDFNYSFERAEKIYNSGEWPNYVYDEMENRLENKGFKSNPPVAIKDYPELQARVNDDEVLAVEANLMKYIDKIIELCKKNDVEVIFYRAPYRSTENELRKANYLDKYFADRNISFVDLEKEIEYDYEEDFNDYEHLSKIGAMKSTDYLGEMIINTMGI